jgi:hypothetical protein
MSKIFRGQAPGPPFRGDRGKEGEGEGRGGEGRGREGGRERGRGREGRKGDWMEWEGGSIPQIKFYHYTTAFFTVMFAVIGRHSLSHTFLISIRNFKYP